MERGLDGIGRSSVCGSGWGPVAGMIWGFGRRPWFLNRGRSTVSASGWCRVASMMWGCGRRPCFFIERSQQSSRNGGRFPYIFVEPWYVCRTVVEIMLWKSWYVRMSFWETLVRLRACCGNPGTFPCFFGACVCLLRNPWYLCMPFM